MPRRTPRTRRNPVPFTSEQQAQVDALPVWIHNAYTGERVRPATRQEYRSARPGRNPWDADKRMVSLGYGESEVVGEPYDDGRPSFLDDLGLRLVTRFSKELLGTSEQGEYEAWRSQSWDERGGVSVDRPDIPRHAVTWAGFPWPREALLYHATRALGPISREGFKTRRQGTAAMGGGRHVYSVSLTLVPERAVAFALAFDTLARVAQGKMSLRDLMARLAVEAPRSFRLALEVDGDLHLLRVDPDAVSRLDEGWVFISVGDQEAWLRPENVAGWRAANTDKRVYLYDRAAVAFSIYSASLRSGFSTGGEAFNPILMGTDMAALAKTPLSDIGIVVVRTSTPRICVAAGKATTRLGYTVVGDSDRVAFSENDCERDIEDEIEVRSGGTRRAWTKPEEARSTFASRQRYAEGDPYARLDTNFEVGTRTPETVMVFNEGEEEVRIFDPSKISVVETWDMSTIRRMFNLGDRITLPNFSSDEKDISLWPLLKDAPPMRDNPRTPRTRRNGFFASKEERERKEREKTKVERGLDTARTTQAVTTVGILAAKKVAPRVAAKAGVAVAAKVGVGVAGRAVPFLGEALMVAGAGKEAYKVVKRRTKEGLKSGSWKTDLAKIGAGAIGLEDFVPDAPKKNPRRRNPPTPKIVNYTMTEADRRWFGDSKIVDERGMPLALYHGSQNPNLVFGRERSVYATSRHEVADSFAKGDFLGSALMEDEIPTTYVLLLHMENPKVFTTDEEYETYFQDVSISPAQWKSKGYDGLIYLPEDKYGDPYYAVFGPEQVRVIAKYDPRRSDAS